LKIYYIFIYKNREDNLKDINTYKKNILENKKKPYPFCILKNNKNYIVYFR